MFLKGFKLSFFFCLLFIFFTLSLRAQSVLDDIPEEDKSDSLSPSSDQPPALFPEKIKVISPSRKIFILTNENQSFNKGDFISLLLTNSLVCRALVAKTTTEKLSGIKVLKIYNLELWKKLEVGKEVLVLKGDDGYYSNKGKEKDKKKEESKVQTEDDLYNSTSIGNEDDLNFDDNSKRLIKPDNLVSGNIGLIQGRDVDGTKKNYTHLNGAWAYQVADNIWAEAQVGTNVVRDYPYTGLDTRMTNIEIRGKYTVAAPLYTYLLPYLGYQTILASSPTAGTDPGDGSRSAVDLSKELKMVDELKKSSIIFGVTILKRIVPGWFIRVDLGSDIINGGLTVEF